MAEKITGISRDLIFHPGVTLLEIMENRDISQAELATRTGVSSAFISNVVAGKKDISSGFAMALEYALGIPNSFWLNLQANYDSELMVFEQIQTITDEEIRAKNELVDVIKYLRNKKLLPTKQDENSLILSLRKILQISNLGNLGKLVPAGCFRIANSNVNHYVLGAWIRLCDILKESQEIDMIFNLANVDTLIKELKKIMCTKEVNLIEDLTTLLSKYGIGFSIVQNFRGAPVQGYISFVKDGMYQMVLTLRQSYADIFWFSLFHELGHIVNGDVKKNSFIDTSNGDNDKEKAADLFACNALVNEKVYIDFKHKKDFSIEAIKDFAQSQNVMPYIVIGRLQKEKYISYSQYSSYKIRYKGLLG